MHALRVAAAIIATLVAAQMGTRAAVAQRGAGRAGHGVILGAVTDTALRALTAVNVQVIGTTAQLTTGDDGRFRIQDVSPGEYLVWIRRLGFQPVSHLVRVEAGDTLRLSYTLEPTPTELKTVTVTERVRSPKMREFDERRKFGQGHFMTQLEIDKLNFVRLEGVLRTFTAIRVEPDRTGGTKAMSSRFGACPMQIYLDGIPLGSKLDDLPSPKEIGAIEVYAGPATAPFGFSKGMSGASHSGNPSCGVIFLWTRDGS